MSFLRKLLPVAVFGLSLAGTLVFRKSGTPDTSPETNPLSGASPAPRTKTARSETTFAAVKALLRDGKIDAARDLLHQLGAQDPAAFFKLLSRLPGLPGMEDIIRETAESLPWDQQDTTDLLNRISSDDWKILAWQSYITAQVGLRSDQEIYDISRKADGNASTNCLIGLLKDAAEKRPDAMLAILNRKSGMSTNMMFFGEVMKFHPERASELFRSIPDGAPGSAYSKSYILQTRIKAQPTAENLQAVLLERGNRGVYDWSSGSFLVGNAISEASPQQKAEILEWIGTQPPLARNRLLGGIVFSTMFDYNDPISPADFSKVLDTYTSGYMQEKALDNWLKRNKDLDQKDPNWINHLPTERLRNHALGLREKRMAVPGP